MIERAYGVTILDIRTLPSGSPANCVLLAKAKEGTFFAKIYSPNENSYEDVSEEVHLLEYLIKQNTRVPILVHTRDGQALVRTRDAYTTILMKQEELRVVTAATATREELRGIAFAVARMHNILLDYPRKEHLKKYTEDPDFRQHDWDTYHRLVASPFGKSFTENELAMVKSVDLAMTGYMRKNYPPVMNAFSVIHGDLTLDHVQLLPDGTPYFFDFADKVWGPIARELAVFLVRLFTSETGAATFERWEELREVFLNGYQSVNNLPDAEMKAIRVMMLKRLSEATVGYDTDILEYERNPEIFLRTRKRRYTLAEYLLNQS